MNAADEANSDATVRAADASADREMVLLFARLGLKCPACEYDLSRCESVVCPECGKHVRMEDYRMHRGLPRNYWLVASIVGACLLVFAVPAGLMAAFSYMTLPNSAEGLVVLIAVLAMGGLLWVLAFRPIRVLALPTALRRVVLGSLSLCGVVAVGLILALPIYLVVSVIGLL
jgi:hypothetical protein